MSGLGIFEIIVLLAIVVLFTGTGRLTSLGTLLGRCVGHFQQGRRDAEAIDITPDKTP